jgi:hypothetical protein
VRPHCGCVEIVSLRNSATALGLGVRHCVRAMEVTTAVATMYE